MQKCEHGVYWPEGHAVPFACGFCNPEHYDSALTERNAMPINVAYALYKKVGTNTAKEALGESLMRYMYGIVGKTNTAEETPDDLVQNGLLEIWSNIESFKGDSSFSTWVSGIVAHTTADAVSRTKSLREVLLITEIGKPGKHTAIEAKLTLKALVEKLSTEDKQLVQMKMDGLTEEEIGEAFNKDQKWAKNKWYNLKKQLVQVETQWVTKGPDPVELIDVKRFEPGVRTAKTREGRTVYLRDDEIKEIKVH